MTTASAWLLATRPKTLAAGIAPVLVGTALAHTVTPINWLVCSACLVGALLIQIGANFANDAFDAMKGADSPDRLGPQRAVASGLISARAMLIATAVVLLLALGVGLYLSYIGGWAMFILGMISLICAVGYTGGPWPLAYVGLGDVFVLVFFGWFAVLGSAWVQARGPLLAQASFISDVSLKTFGVSESSHKFAIMYIPVFWWLVATAIGLQATGIIAVNNLRDIATDEKVGKRTLAVRLGDRVSRLYIVLLHIVATISLATAAQLIPHKHLLIPTAIAGVGGLLLCIGMARARGATLNGYLARSAALELVTAISVVVALTI